ncbi:hypothetical protein B0H11DRAFT_1905918 [Mycena galericulata]|nr:hypothetical protein B0H11DRAFT_1905918 [Mycena galericulata]
MHNGSGSDGDGGAVMETGADATEAPRLIAPTDVMCWAQRDRGGQQEVVGDTTYTKSRRTNANVPSVAYNRVRLKDVRWLPPPPVLWSLYARARVAESTGLSLLRTPPVPACCVCASACQCSRAGIPHRDVCTPPRMDHCRCHAATTSPRVKEKLSTITHSSAEMHRRAKFTRKRGTTDTPTARLGAELKQNKMGDRERIYGGARELRGNNDEGCFKNDGNNDEEHEDENDARTMRERLDLRYERGETLLLLWLNWLQFIQWAAYGEERAAGRRQWAKRRLFEHCHLIGVRVFGIFREQRQLLLISSQLKM